MVTIGVGLRGYSSGYSLQETNVCRCHFLTRHDPLLRSLFKVGMLSLYSASQFKVQTRGGVPTKVGTRNSGTDTNAVVLLIMLDEFTHGFGNITACLVQ